MECRAGLQACMRFSHIARPLAPVNSSLLGDVATLAAESAHVSSHLQERYDHAGPGLPGVQGVVDVCTVCV